MELNRRYWILFNPSTGHPVKNALGYTRIFYYEQGAKQAAEDMKRVGIKTDVKSCHNGEEF